MEQIQQIKGDLESALSKKDSTKAIESLQSLVNIPVTLIVLQDTHIGATVNKVRRQFEDQEVVSLSRSLMRKWKKIFEQYKESRGENNNSISAQDGDNSVTSSSDLQQDKTNTANSVSSTSVKQSGGAAGESKEKDLATSNTNSKPPTASTSQGNSNGNKMSAPTQAEVPQTSSTVRLKFREMIVQALKTPLPKELQKSEPFLDEEILGARIEDHIFQEFKSESDMKYKNRLRSRILNLKDSKNPYLRLNVLRGDISPEQIAKMSAEEMASDELKRQREIYTKEAINDHQMSLTTGTRTSEIKCPACKKYDCTYNQMQTRSSDEPMTTFCYCNNCGKRWKFC